VFALDIALYRTRPFIEPGRVALGRALLLIHTYASKQPDPRK